MKLPLPVLAAIAALSSAFASAKVVSFPTDNFSIDAPADWASFPLPPMPPHCRMITAARSSSNGHFYDVMTMDLSLRGSPEAFLVGMQKPLIAKGWKASPIRDETIDGRPFAVFSMSRETGPPFMLMATTFADDHVYAVQVGAPDGNVEEQPDLNAIVKSFHFLKPVQSFSRHDRTTGAGQNDFAISRNLGRFAGILLVLSLVIFLFNKATKSSR